MMESGVKTTALQKSKRLQTSGVARSETGHNQGEHSKPKPENMSVNPHGQRNGRQSRPYAKQQLLVPDFAGRHHTKSWNSLRSRKKAVAYTSGS